MLVFISFHDYFSGTLARSWQNHWRKHWLMILENRQELDLENWLCFQLSDLEGKRLPDCREILIHSGVLQRCQRYSYGLRHSSGQVQVKMSILGGHKMTWNFSLLWEIVEEWVRNQLSRGRFISWIEACNEVLEWFRFHKSQADVVFNYHFGEQNISTIGFFRDRTLIFENYLSFVGWRVHCTLEHA